MKGERLRFERVLERRGEGGREERRVGGWGGEEGMEKERVRERRRERRVVMLWGVGWGGLE